MGYSDTHDWASTLPVTIFSETNIRLTLSTKREWPEPGQSLEMFRKSESWPSHRILNFRTRDVDGCRKIIRITGQTLLNGHPIQL